MLDGIRGHIVHEGQATSIARPSGETEATPLKTHSATLEIPRMKVGEFTQQHQAFLEGIAEQFAASQSRQVIEAITLSTEKTGNIIDGKGEKFSEDLMYKALESMAHSFGPDGQWEAPSLVVSPEQMKRIVEHEKSRTPEERAAFDKRLKNLIIKKKAEHDSEQAGRILAG
ncbi:MAG TPA: hypothetical protein DCF81_12395 [Erythrobacter sp.]|nr:hypothetical protein [Erythrobacter sp.]